MAQKLRMVELMWRVAYADGQLGEHERHVMWRIADLLHVPQGAYVHARMRAREAAGSSERRLAVAVGAGWPVRRQISCRIGRTPPLETEKCAMPKPRQLPSVSLDGYGAGPPGPAESARRRRPRAASNGSSRPGRSSAMHGQRGGETGVDNDDGGAEASPSIGAWILGRNMFGPVRGPWPDESWKGWWGDEPPYHMPVFVLTHHARAPLEMKGGTSFISSPTASTPRSSARRTRPAARTCGSAAASPRSGSICSARLIDELHLAHPPPARHRRGAARRHRPGRRSASRRRSSASWPNALHVVLTRGAV